MKIVIAPDSFKENLSAAEVARAIEKGVRRARENIETEIIPMADGGEGTVEALVAATGGKCETAEVTGPLGERVQATFGILGNGRTAVIEMAAASGLSLVPAEKRNPLLTTTIGTGELIVAALDRGAREFIIGIGGSATVDGGAGMASALGVRFLDEAGKPIGSGGAALGALAKIDAGGRDPRIAESHFHIATDVDNPLTGPKGAAAVFGPQKGATPEMVETLDKNLARMAAVIRDDLGKDVENVPGAGAAGGLGGGLVALLDADISLGVELVLEATRFRSRVEGADLVITGEGRLDPTSAHGKAPLGVAKAAKAFNVPVVAICGSVGLAMEVFHEKGIDAAFSAMNDVMSLEQAFARSRELLAFLGEQVTRLFIAGRLGVKAENST